MNTIRINKDEDLLRRIQKGDEVAFELVFFRYKGKLFDFIRRSIPHGEDAESMVQEIFVRLWVNRQQLDPAKSLNALLYTMARNELFGYLRKLIVRRRYLEELSYSMSDSSETTAQQLEYDEFKSVVARLVGAMPEKRREIYVLSRNEGLSYKEIATQLGISENTVDSQIRKALTFLKENLRRNMSVFLFFIHFRQKKLV